VKKTVIIVDDSNFLVRKLQDFFQGTGDYEIVATGSNGNQAVELYREHRPDLITLDITMPVKDGRQALAEIMAAFPDARAIIISAVTGSTILECVKAGAKGYVEKPLRFEDEDFRKDFLDTLEEAFSDPAGKRSGT
jgi:two-component system chemotaxis response regulator CheY